MANGTSGDAERKREYQRNWRRQNPDKMREYRERYSERIRERREQNRGKQKEYDRRSYVKNGERIRARAREANARLSPDERWARHLKTRHGMSPAQWHAMFEEQDGKCYLCMRPLPVNRSKIDVDHDHGHCGDNGSCSLCWRGLACHDCNTAIGFFGDSPERLRVAAGNLERAQAVTGDRVASALFQGSLF